ncbi:hypothetical protein H4S08_004665 [Coemansia sp. RSA 1365]|nr:hypothetical protein H4S08_004665 [Coemansia sp. RSA 1365]
MTSPILIGRDVLARCRINNLLSVLMDHDAEHSTTMMKTDTAKPTAANDSSYQDNMIAVLTAKPQVMDSCWRYAVLKEDTFLPPTTQGTSKNIAGAILFCLVNSTQAITIISVPMDHLIVACHIANPSEAPRGVNGCGNSINSFSCLSAFSSHAVSAEETPLMALSETFHQVHPLGQSRTGQLLSTGCPHLLPQVLMTMAARSTDQVALILACLLQVTANGSKIGDKPFKCSTKAVDTNSTNELPLQMLSRFQNIIVQPGVAHNLSAYQVRMALAFGRVHKHTELAQVNCVVFLERATGLQKVTRKVPFKIGSSHHDSKFSHVKDDYAAATIPLSGALKAQHLISIDKEERLADDGYKVKFI